MYICIRDENNVIFKYRNKIISVALGYGWISFERFPTLHEGVSEYRWEWLHRNIAGHYFCGEKKYHESH